MSSDYKYDPVAKEFKPAEDPGPQASPGGAEPAGPAQPEDPRPVRRRRKRKSPPDDLFRDSGEKKTWWKICLWVLIIACALAWAAMLVIQHESREKKPQGDKVLHLEREDVMPNLDY